MGLIGTLVTFVKSVKAKSDDINSNFSAVKAGANDITNAQINAAAGIAQTKIDSVTPDITALNVKDKDSATTVGAVEHDNGDVGDETNAAENHSVGLDAKGFLPLKALRGLWEQGGDSAFAATTSYKVAAAKAAMTGTTITIDTGLTTIIACIGTIWNDDTGALVTCGITDVSGGDVDFIASVGSLELYWIAIGT